MLVGIFSPLVKMFVPSHTVWRDKKPVLVTLDQLQEDPEALFSTEKFAISIPRSAGDQRFTSGAPRFLRDEELVAWLTGGAEGTFCKETDWTGAVQVRMPAEAMGEMMAAMASGEASEDVQGELAMATKAAMAVSHERCMRQVRFVYENYLSQVTLNKEQGLGDPRFSPTEYLASKVLARSHKATLEKESARRREMEEISASLTEQTKAHGPRA